MALGSGPTIVAKFIADTSQLTSGVDKATGQAGNQLKSFGKKAALALGTGFVTDKVLDFGKASVTAASDDAAAQAQLAAALKNTTGATADQIAASEDYVSNLSKSAAISDDELRPALATLARGFGNTEDAQRALSIATDVAAGTGKDLSTVTDAMGKAALGSTGGLAKLGVATKDAAGNALSMDQIMQNLASTFDGQAAVAAESTAGQIAAANIAMGEFSETIGTALLPVVAKLAVLFTDTLLPAISAVVSWITDHKEVVIAALTGIGVVVLAAVIPAFVAWSIAAGAAAIATLAAAAPFIALGAVIAGVAFLIIHNWDTIRAAAQTAWNFVLGIIQGVFGWVKSNWPLLLAIITGPIGAAVLIITRNWDTIKTAATSVYEWVKGKWDAIGAAIGATVGTITGFINTIVTQIKRPIAAATEVFNWVRDKFNAIAGAISGVVGGITSSIGKIVSAIKGPINAVIGAWNRLEFRIPSISIPKVHIPGTNKDIGGGSFGGQTIGFPDVPKLAAGGVLTAPTLFVGGEAGTEIVAPEELLRRIIAEESTGGSYTLNIYPRTVDAADLAYGFRRLELLAGHR